MHLYTYIHVSIFSGPTFTNVKIRGFDYVEDSTPYSSLFRPVTPVPFTSHDYNIIGTTKEMPSSATLFGDWYFSQTGMQPSYYTVSLWAAFDVLEKVLYMACYDPHVMSRGTVTPQHVNLLLSFVECNTPFGSVSFDADRVNMKTQSIFVQQHLYNESLVIVAPLGMYICLS
jgi:hypothetical protein